MLAIKRLAGVAPKMDVREYTLHLPPQKEIGRINFGFEPKIQNQGTIGPNIGQVYMSAQNIKTSSHVKHSYCMSITFDILANCLRL